MNRQQFNRSHAELLEVGDGALVGEGSVGSANVIWQCRVAAGQASGVGFVDYDLV